MTPDQCRAAREHRNWARDELRKAADVPLWFVAAFEDGKETPGFLVCWEVAIEAALGDAGAFEIARTNHNYVEVTYELDAKRFNDVQRIVHTIFGVQS